MSIKEKGLQYWLPYYFLQRLFSSRRSSKNSVHIMLCLVDHFEPFHGGVDVRRAEKRLKAWAERYPHFAPKQRHADGKPQQHTWFYPPFDPVFFKDLVGLCKRGYGEIEMHLQHDHMEPFPDTSATSKAISLT
jgi:hypothetical protein